MKYSEAGGNRQARYRHLIQNKHIKVKHKVNADSLIRVRIKLSAQLNIKRLYRDVRNY